MMNHEYNNFGLPIIAIIESHIPEEFDAYEFNRLTGCIPQNV